MNNIFEMRDVKSDSGKTVRKPFNLTTNKQYASKSQASAVIDREVQADESLDKKHLRAAYIDRVMVELELSKSGAGTYYGNEQRVAKGLPKFGLNSKSNKKAAARNKSVKVLAKAERWRVMIKGTKKLVDSFTSRSAAQSFNRDQKAAGVATVMVDGNKKAA